MERENDEHINLLHGKVSALKEMTIQIGNHVKEDINMLDGMVRTARGGSAHTRTLAHQRAHRVPLICHWLCVCCPRHGAERRAATSTAQAGCLGAL
mmetsp:Transcript_14455/g.37433  ORF Transcript_14455/g.37433 Transcript_14455/m.37433 type:complete len:96 (+) Transcript_14455:300-587(+)